MPRRLSSFPALLIVSATTFLFACHPGPSEPVPLAAPLDLPGPAYYPESIAAAKDGTIFAGSLTSGEIVKFVPGASTPEAPEVFRQAGADGVKGVTGLLVDDSAQQIWFCAVDLSFSSSTSLNRASLGNGALLASFPFPEAGAFCNDLALDGQGNLYVTDSLGGTVAILKKGANALMTWSQEAEFKPSPGALGPNGIAWDGTGAIFMSTFNAGALYRIPIQADGSAGPAVAITVQPALAGPDGIRLVDSDTLLVAEGIGNRISRVAVTGSTATATPLDTRVDQPSSLVVIADAIWVTEGQIEGLLLSKPSQTPSLPFEIVRTESQP